MRVALVRALTDLVEADQPVMLLTADLGFRVLEPFITRFPGRFLNGGVAEQNLVGVATGLAEAGFVPFVYSIATFATLRPYEFIRNGPVLHNLPVRVVGVGGGLAYGVNGFTHYGLEDVGVMRCQPGMTIVVPADAAQAEAAIRATWDLPGPVYYRLGKDGGASVPGLFGRFRLGRPETVREGSDLILLCLGPIAVEALRAAELLSGEGLEAEVQVVSTLRPGPHPDLVAALERHRVALTVEVHYRTGGLGSLACELVAEGGLNCRVVRCGVAAIPDGMTGSQAYMERANGLGAETLAAAALEAMARTPCTIS